MLVKGLLALSSYLICGITDFVFSIPKGPLVPHRVGVRSNGIAGVNHVKGSVLKCMEVCVVSYEGSHHTVCIAKIAGLGVHHLSYLKPIGKKFSLGY